MSISIRRESHNGWSNVWRIANGQIEVKVVADVGPRIMHLGFVGERNELYEAPDDLGKTGGDQFRMYGGHRLWVAPETERTTFPDNREVTVTPTERGARFVAPTEGTGLQKTVEVSLHPERARVTVVHQVANRAEEPTSAAPWALTVLQPAGMAILPLPERAPWGPEHLLPVTSIALWAYTDLSLPCWRPGTKYIQLDQTLVADCGFGMQKLGLRNSAGWAAYHRAGTLFVKTSARATGSYVDFGSNFEVFAERKFIEIETLGPETPLDPGAAVEHVERWGLFRDVAAGNGDEWADREVLPRASDLKQNRQL